MKIPTPRRLVSAELLIAVPLILAACVLFHELWRFLPDLLDHLMRAHAFSLDDLEAAPGDLLPTLGDPS